MARLINSREGGPWDGVAWLFDQAQAVIAFAAARDRARAGEALRALEILQLRDGSFNDGTWCTSYFVDGTCRDTTRRSGSLAWVVVAVNYYEWVEKDPAYSDMAEAALGALAKLTNADPLSEEFGAVGLGPDIPGVYASEHQADTYAALSVRSTLRGGLGKRESAERMRRFLLGRMDFGPCPGSGDWKVWLAASEQVFNAGGACAFPDLFACPQTFTSLSLGPPRPGELDYLAALDSIWVGGSVDMVVSDQYRRPSDYATGPDKVTAQGLDLGVSGNGTGDVFFIGETSAGYAAADFLLGDGSRGAFLMAEMAGVLYPDGGLPYSTDTGVNDPHKAVASTAWLYFNSADPRVNPLNPADYEVGGSLSLVLEGTALRLTWAPVPADGPVTYDILSGDRPDQLVPIDQVVDTTTWVDPSPGAPAFYAVSVRRP